MKYLEDSAITAELDASEHGGLYAEAVGRLGQKSNLECIAFPHSTNLVSTTGYLFEYRGIQPSSKSHGYTRFEGFTIRLAQLFTAKRASAVFAYEIGIWGLTSTPKTDVPRTAIPRTTYGMPQIETSFGAMRHTTKCDTTVFRSLLLAVMKTAK
jgi:hypothetical protein